MTEEDLKYIEDLLEGREDIESHPAEPISNPFQTCTTCENARGSYRSTVPTPIEGDDVRYIAWKDYLSRWSLSYPCKLVLSPEKQILEDGKYYLRISFEYPDERDYRDGSSLPKSSGLWPPSMFPDEDTPRWLRENLLYHLNHELDENLQFDGNNVFDPHRINVYCCAGCMRKMILLESVPKLIEEIRRLSNGSKP